MEILTRLRGLQQLCLESSNENFAEVFGAAADEIDRLNGVDKMDWISVDDRLPESTGDYLTYNPTSVYYKYSVNTRYESKWENSSKFITHWMPMPKPPQENKK